MRVSRLVTYQEYLSCYRPDFDQILKVGSLDHLKQIQTVMVTFVHVAFVLAIFVHTYQEYLNYY